MADRQKEFSDFVRSFEGTDILGHAHSIDLSGTYFQAHRALVEQFRNRLNEARYSVWSKSAHNPTRDTADDGLLFLFKLFYDMIYMPELLNSEPKKRQNTTRINLERKIQSWLKECNLLIGEKATHRLDGQLLVEALPYGLELVMHAWYVLEEDEVNRVHGNPNVRAVSLSSNLSQLAEHARTELKQLAFTHGYSNAYKVPPNQLLDTGRMAFVIRAVHGSLERYQEHLMQTSVYFDYFIDQLKNKKSMDYLVNGVSSMLRDEQSLSSRLGGIISSQTDKLSSWLTRAALGKAIHEHKALEAVYRLALKP